ncbi:MAG: Spy/CpxP family protein refolding chaperone [Trinickia sp.]
MSVTARLSVLVCLAGFALAGTALADATSQQKGVPRDDCGRWGQGAGMMGGWGNGAGMMGYGAGPGMMGYGAGPGMMRGRGMGPGGMMQGAWAGGLDLTDEQRTKINQIQDETRKSHWALMGSMMDQQSKLRDLYEAPKRDTAAIDSAYKSMDDMRQQMISSSADASKRIEAILTKKQLEKLRTYQRQEDELGW